MKFLTAIWVLVASLTAFSNELDLNCTHVKYLPSSSFQGVLEIDGENVTGMIDIQSKNQAGQVTYEFKDVYVEGNYQVLDGIQIVSLQTPKDQNILGLTLRLNDQSIYSSIMYRANSWEQYFSDCSQ